MSTRKRERRRGGWSPAAGKGPYHSREIADHSKRREIYASVQPLRAPNDEDARAVFLLDTVDELESRNRRGRRPRFRNLAVGVAQSVPAAKREADRAARDIIRGKPRLKK